MGTRELDAAGITDPRLRASYAHCRRLNAQHGRTYFLSTMLLPAAKRPHVHALYGLARHADEYVDSLTDPDPQALRVWSDQFLADLERGSSEDPVGAAAIHTINTWDIPHELFHAFIRSMCMDITVTRYETYGDLVDYMYGSAAVIGLQMLPILEPRTPEAAPHARALGEAFQLSNFIRDVGEDLERGRVYLPQEDLRAFGVTDEDLAAGVLTPRIRELLRFEIARTREIYRHAKLGVPMLHPTSRDCIRTAISLYSGILTAVEQADYDILRHRVSVPMSRRLAVAVPGLTRAHRSRRVESRWVAAASA